MAVKFLCGKKGEEGLAYISKGSSKKIRWLRFYSLFTLYRVF